MNDKLAPNQKMNSVFAVRSYAVDSGRQVPSFEPEVAALGPVLQARCKAVCDWAVREGLQGALQFCAYRDGKCIVDVYAGTMPTNAGAAAMPTSRTFRWQLSPKNLRRRGERCAGSRGNRLRAM